MTGQRINHREEEGRLKGLLLRMHIYSKISRSKDSLHSILNTKFFQNS